MDRIESVSPHLFPTFSSRRLILVALLLFGAADLRGAAGNSMFDLDSQLLFPASYNFENTITVAATDPQDQLVAWSNFASGTAELAAPGYSIRSTVPQRVSSTGPNRRRRTVTERATSQRVGRRWRRRMSPQC